MFMKIATIVSSNSHVDYIGRIVDDLDAAEPPPPDSYGFGQFVEIESSTAKTVGVIYDSRLINPEYSNFGPRLSPKPAIENFTPDFLNEQGILIGILLLGTIDAAGNSRHGVPRSIIPPGAQVSQLGAEDVTAFHRGPDSINLTYYSHVMLHAGTLAVPLLELIVEALSTGSSPADADKLKLIAQNLRWQKTMAAARF